MQELQEQIGQSADKFTTICHQTTENQHLLK